MKYQKGDILAGQVTGITKYGIFVQLDEENTGLIHISEISSYYVHNIGAFVKLGEIIRVRVIEVLENSRYCLSIKNLDYRILHKRRSQIKETSQGFVSLALALNKWLQEEYDEVDNDN